MGSFMVSPSDRNKCVFSLRRVSRCVQRAQHRHRVRVVEVMKDFVGLMGKLNLAPSGTALSALEQALILVGKSRADLCDSRCVSLGRAHGEDNDTANT